LALLREIPPDYVKISGTVVADALSSAESLEILKSFVKLAHSLDVFVIAQQLEKAEQLGPMKLAGVDAAQGYYFGQPS
jgi:EAL domain-containing protein (putative c-di-GMP-specific phosphodiesterase class I)